MHLRARILAIACSALTPVMAVAMPGGGNSTTPACISLVGWNNGSASPRGTFEVVVRDLANNPLVGAIVKVDLSNALDLVLCAQQLAPGIVVDCPTASASQTSDVNGRVVFTLLGGGVGPASTLLGGARIYANGTLIASPTVSAYDLDGHNGVGANDLSLWLTDFGTGNPYGRSDYDCSGGVGANDFSFWLSEFGSSPSAFSCAASCP
jgi:hypothetical protein